MTTQELRELDAWIAENVMGEFLGRTIHTNDVRYEDAERKIVIGMARKYTTDPAASMEVLKKCNRLGCVVMTFVGDEYSIELYGTDKFSEAPTIELAICLFAKQLFTK